MECLQWCTRSFEMSKKSARQRSTAQTLQVGLQEHQAGRLAEAEACYRTILQAEPTHADALHLLGVVAQQVGNYPVAVQLILAAIHSNPRASDYHNNLGNIYVLQGDLAAAAESYRRTMELETGHVDARHSLANLLADQGKLEEAEVEFRRVLEMQPAHADAHYNLGNTKTKQGDLKSAIGCFQEAVKLRPGCAAFHYNLAHAWQGLGALEEAAREYRAVLELTPRDADAQYNQGIISQSRGELAEAAEAFRQTLARRPQHAEALSNLGAVLQQQEHFAGAAEALRGAIALKPELAEAYSNLGGNLWWQGDLAGAEANCRRAIELKPWLAEAHSNLGHVLEDQGDLEAALQCYQRAIALHPERAAAHKDLGGNFWRQGDLARAEETCRKAIELDPKFAEAYGNLGHVLTDRGDLEGALMCYRQAMALKSEPVEAHSELRANHWKGGDMAAEESYRLRPSAGQFLYYGGLVHLLRGEFSKGWANYEYRWQTRRLRRTQRDFTEPLWRGEALHGERILLHAEQGLGDTIQFARYVSMVAARGGEVVLEAQPELCRLLAGIEGATEVIARGDPLPEFEWQCPLLSLPLAFRTELAGIPAWVPYVTADAVEVAKWSRRLAKEKLRVGLVWAGNPKHLRDTQRSIKLEQLEPLGRVDAAFYSLQKGLAAVGPPCALAGMEMSNLGPELKDFADTAAVLAALDLVVTVDTAVAHLAGALGKPVWILLAHSPDWRWLLGREDSPWYPSARLFRQPSLGDWDSVITRMAVELGRVARDR